MALTVGVAGQGMSPTGVLRIDGCIVGYFDKGRLLLSDGMEMGMVRGIVTFYYPTGSIRPGVAHIPRVELAEMVEKGEDVSFTSGLQTEMISEEGP